MDLMYQRYSSPFEFMRMYIDQGRFGELVTDIITAENQRKAEQAEKEAEDKLWAMYVHSLSDKSYNEWKEAVLKPEVTANTGKKDEDMTKEDVDNLLNRLFSNKE